MTATTLETTTAAARLDRRAAPSVEQDLREAAHTLLRAMAEAGLDAPTWQSAGPLVGAAAQQLRKALGTADHGSVVSAPAVVREADVSAAMRPLLAGATVADQEAAQQFVRVAGEAALALS